MFNIKSISIENFKSIEKKDISLDQLHEVFGANATGKSSIQEAAEFACEGGKNDIEKIALGKDKCTVKMLFEHTESEAPLEVLTSLTRKGNLTCKAVFNGINQVNPRTFIKKLISVGSFDPKHILDKKTREEKILGLLPLKIKKEDIKRKNGELFPVALWENINFEQHAWKTLKQIKGDLANTRESLFREKELMVKHQEQEKDSLLKEMNKFFETYKEVPKNVKAPDEVIEKKGRLQQKQLEIEDAMMPINKERLSYIAKIEGNEELIDINGKKILNLVNEMADLKTRLEALKSEKRTALLQNDELKKQAEQANKKHTEMIEERLSLKDELKMIETKIQKSKIADFINKRKKEIDDKDTKVEKSINRYKEFKEMVLKEFPILVRHLLNPIKKKVPHLEITEDGKFTYKKVPLDTLSGSESLILSMKLYMLDKKGAFIFVKEAEAMDKKSMAELAKLGKKYKKQIVAIRVADKPSGGEWVSTEMKEQV